MENKTIIKVPVELSSTDAPFVDISVTNHPMEQNTVYFNFIIDGNHCGFFIYEKNWNDLIESVAHEFKKLG